MLFLSFCPVAQGPTASDVDGEWLEGGKVWGEGLEGSSGQSRRVGEALMQAAGKMKLGVVTPNISGRCHRVF